MLQLRLIVPSDLAPTVLAHLDGTDGVAHVVHLPGTATRPAGDVILCDVVREAANEVVEWLQRRGVHRRGAIVLEAAEAVVSDAARDADQRAPGHGADVLVWEELEARARQEADLNVSFLLFMSIAAVLAGIGILLDSPILVVGAMVVGPEYGPLSALCVAAVRRRPAPAARAAATLAAGLAAAGVAAFAATAAFRLAGVAPDGYVLSTREQTAFIAHPDALAAVVALLAGVVGMLSLTQARSGALIGVLVSVTTIPAVGNIGVAAAYREWSEMGGAALQLGVNLAGLVASGLVTLTVQARVTARSL